MLRLCLVLLLSQPVLCKTFIPSPSNCLFKVGNASSTSALFRRDVPRSTWRALSAYHEQRTLPNGLVYGRSVRNLSLPSFDLKTVERTLNDNGFRKTINSLKDTSGVVKRDEVGPIPIWIFLHPDGGAIKLKPRGDVTDPHRKKPHGSRFVRYSYNAFGDYNHEAFKVGEKGQALPKSPKELVNPCKNSPFETSYLNGWGEATHFSLMVE